VKIIIEPSNVVGNLFPVKVKVAVARAAIERLARIGEVPEGQLASLNKYLCAVLAILAGTELNPEGKFTRRELVEALEGLLSAAKTLEQRLRKKWLGYKIEQLQFEIAGVGRDALLADLPEISAGVGPDASWADPPEISNKHQAIQRQIADLVQHVSAMLKKLETMPERPDEQLKRKGATKSTAQYLARCVLQFWIAELSRPARITQDLVAFADRVFRIAGYPMEPAALHKRLHLELSTLSEKCDTFLMRSIPR
jgi:hypothetical protein